MSTKWVSFIAAGILFSLSILGIGIGYLSARNTQKKTSKKQDD